MYVLELQRRFLSSSKLSRMLLMLVFFLWEFLVSIALLGELTFCRESSLLLIKFSFFSMREMHDMHFSLADFKASFSAIK